MLFELTSLIVILTLGAIYYRVCIYDKWEAANSRIAKHELDSIPWIPYDRRETTIFDPVK